MQYEESKRIKIETKERQFAQFKKQKIGFLKSSFTCIILHSTVSETKCDNVNILSETKFPQQFDRKIRFTLEHLLNIKHNKARSKKKSSKCCRYFFFQFKIC